MESLKASVTTQTLAPQRPDRLEAEPTAVVTELQRPEQLEAEPTAPNTEEQNVPVTVEEIVARLASFVVELEARFDAFEDRVADYNRRAPHKL